MPDARQEPAAPFNGLALNTDIVDTDTSTRSLRMPLCMKAANSG